MNPFERYRYINAEEIIKANIRPNHVGEDVGDLLNALRPVTCIAKPDSQKWNLHQNVIQKLTPKPHALELLNPLGYELNERGDYVYQKTNSTNKITSRENAANEFQIFYNDLKKIREGSLNGFEEFIERTSNQPEPQYDDDDDFTQEQQQRPSSSASVRSLSPPRMPDIFTVKSRNEKTSETIRSFKESIIPKHGGRVVHSFIRRKLLFFLFIQKYPDSMEFDEVEVDRAIDQRVLKLKQSDRNQNPVVGDEIYYECLIRSNLEHDLAFEILRNNRPNLQPPPEPEIPRGPTTTTIDSSLQCVRQQWMLLNQNANENGADQMLIHEGDEWKNTMHVVTAIIQLRQKYNNQGVNDIIVDKMYRLIYAELSRIVGPQSYIKIELLAYALCEVPRDSLEHLNMSDIRDILRSCRDTEIREDFQENVVKSLSMECPVCGGSYPRSHMETMYLCNHIYCIDCIKTYYRITVKEISDPKSLRKLTCIMEAHEISDDVKLNFFQHLGTKFNQWFTDERLILDAYQENLYMATRDSQDKKCGNPRCVGFFYNNNNNRIAQARCPHCQFQQCQQCCRKWHNEHTNMTCEEYAAWLTDNDPDDPEVQLTKYLNTAGMICPNEPCKAIYEYQAGGCEHFTCPACKTEFCRICSALFCNPHKNTTCTRATCGLKNALHAHCYLNCFREIRDAEVDEIIRLLTANKINAAEELQQKPQATGIVCPVDGCKNAPSATYENRFCETCYKQFLCLFVWRNQIEPWELYTDNNLRQKLIGASIAVPATAARPALIALARQHLTQFLGKPKPIPRIRQ